MPDFLEAMAISSRSRARALRARSAALMESAESAPPAQRLNMIDPGFDVLAEIKLRSPAVGSLRTGNRSLADLARSYENSGAAAISVLTEPDRFDGHIEHLRTVTASVDAPVMRKDFLVDPLQVYEARAAGASGILLIAKILDPANLISMTDLAIDMGMFVLVEVFDQQDLDIAVAVFDRNVLLGVNCRDLTTLEVRFERFRELAEQLPAHLPTVAESGITSSQHAATVSELGFRMALVGTALMGSPSPEATIHEMLIAGRATAVGART